MFFTSPEMVAALGEAAYEAEFAAGSTLLRLNRSQLIAHRRRDILIELERESARQLAGIVENLNRVIVGLENILAHLRNQQDTQELGAGGRNPLRKQVSNLKRFYPKDSGKHRNDLGNHIDMSAALSHLENNLSFD